jgi:hypothetical protein
MQSTARRLRNIFLALAAALGAISVATAPRESPAPSAPLLEGAQADPRVLSILRRSCQDCHSDAPHYPWYSYIAPVSLLIRDDVTRGRDHLNLSRWSSYPVIRKQRLLSEIANQVRDREMPVPAYTFIHRDARLSDAEIDAVFQWTQAERARLIATAAAPR